MSPDRVPRAQHNDVPISSFGFPSGSIQQPLFNLPAGRYADGLEGIVPVFCWTAEPVSAQTN